MTGYQDHFSSRATGYAAFRPTYPAALFEWLGEITPGRELALDCATGSGQAAAGLAPVFRRVIATDASAAQIANAKPLPNVEYRIARAESSGLPDQVVDVITVAQALHWIDRPAFYAEARRVGRPGAILAVWMYHLARVDPAIDRVLERFFSDEVGAYWPGDRVLVEERYHTIEFPSGEMTTPSFGMEADWTVRHMLGYLRTWSAVTRYIEDRGHDPVASLELELTALWGGSSASRRVCWPLSLRVAKL